MLDPARDLLRVLFKETAIHFHDAQLAQILLLATEGMRFMRMLGLLPDAVAQDLGTHERLLALAHELETR